MVDYMEVAFQIEPPSDSGKKSEPVKKDFLSPKYLCNEEYAHILGSAYLIDGATWSHLISPPKILVTTIPGEYPGHLGHNGRIGC